eukprot:CAMPEP_0198267596 /NCGR_PEP_ID=MMETSP1447-20131203/33745_1 /TAXON_ID=420782 /ORGANISM="Chaetoceros dichaeta, Strain CCMP1751" /LENGTH=49 /DNA_ID=CAMNT_0043958263 /DNA_START=1470 /DNA_END=1619 /DNA_ORIENTATION=-
MEAFCAWVKSVSESGTTSMLASDSSSRSLESNVLQDTVLPMCSDVGTST